MEKKEFPITVNVAVYQRREKGEVIPKDEKISTKFIEEELKGENWESLKWYRDFKKSTNDERPAYNRLIKDIFEENVNFLIIIGDITKLSMKNELLLSIAKKIDIIGMSKKGNQAYYKLYTPKESINYKCKWEWKF